MNISVSSSQSHVGKGTGQQSKANKKKQYNTNYCNKSTIINDKCAYIGYMYSCVYNTHTWAYRIHAFIHGN